MMESMWTSPHRQQEREDWIKRNWPNLSKSTVEANPQIFAPGTLGAVLTQESNKNALAGQVGGKKRGSMNKTEEAYSMILEAMKKDAKILNWRFESVKLRLGDNCWYIPDFFVERRSPWKPLFIEIKGFLRDDARVKFLTAKEIHGWASFEMWQKKKGQWKQIY